MPHPHETAYPRLKSTITEAELAEIYTPTPEEIAFAEAHTQSETAKVGVLLSLKTFQRLGYFPAIAEIPRRIVRHITGSVSLVAVPDGLATYDTSHTRVRHLSLIRARLHVTAYSRAVRPFLLSTGQDAAQIKEDLADIINVLIETLIRHRYELPAFSTLERIAFTARALINRRYHHRIAVRLDATQRARLETLLTRAADARRSPWDTLKQPAKNPTVKHMREAVAHLQWLQQHDLPLSVFAEVPAVKLEQFAAEARSLDLYDLNRLRWSKRYALAAIVVRQQVAKAVDELTEMFLRQMHKLHTRGEEALDTYRKQQAERTDALIARLQKITRIVTTPGPADSRLLQILAALQPDPSQVLEQCMEHQAYAGNNYYPFLRRYYRSQRALFFHFLHHVTLQSTSQDRTVEEAIAVLRTHQETKDPQLTDIGHLTLTWIPDKWWPLVTGRTRRSAHVAKVDRRYFELCLFSQMWMELKSGDLAVAGSDTFRDYREQLVFLADYERDVVEYAEQVGLPVDGKAFVTALQTWLETRATQTDASFPDNEYARIENSEIVLRKLSRRPVPDGVPTLERALQERMPHLHLLDILSETDHWLQWTRHFGPLSGFEAKLDRPRERYVTTTFCYGCNLGPTQTARSMTGVERKQLAHVNTRHSSEARLDASIVDVVNAYNQFALPQFWGSGRHVSADGTKWDVYEQNLLAEYHIRYGGWGGIGYYHVSDRYIALFSRFIPCGVWEGSYILDGLMANATDLHPDLVHADTQGQSTAIFGLAYLLGIQLMPRIRNWKDLKFFRPTKHVHYEHIESLFADPINWRLIESLLPDMLRVGLSIKAGLLTPSTILRRLGTYSRKNRL
jgi:hypothetical protein